VLSVRDVASRLGVSTGSFYWHFRNRDDFLKQLGRYWAKEYTTRAIEVISEVQGNAKQRLLALMELLEEGDFPVYDLAIRSWAAQEPVIARAVKRADRQRLAYVGSLFQEMGFRGDELAMRTRTFAIYQSFDRSFSGRSTKKAQGRIRRARHALLTKR
jgi:AcrR family transcriptional regulator